MGLGLTHLVVMNTANNNPVWDGNIACFVGSRLAKRPQQLKHQNNITAVHPLLEERFTPTNVL